MLNCPACHKLTISKGQKFFTGPLGHFACPECQAELSVSWYSSLSMVVFLVILAGLSQHASTLKRVVTYVVGVAAYMTIHMLLVPLVARKR